ncbi:thioredoxin family protein [Salisaeta longa]|uniref:thioredoxin family protein n=1 Tax=Salisaeta longa TaxID=503170 RepID=UPI00048FA8FC|nr:thioredoxin family protein [Salisaeta longa]
MALTESIMEELGQTAPAFELPIANPSVDDRAGDTRALSDFDDAEALVIVFMCNHCPYVQHIEDALVDVARSYQARGVQFVGICSNDPEQYPQDNFEAMAQRAEAHNYSFPYLHDPTQAVAKAYGAVCTPDIFVYDADRTLVYRGRFDETSPKRGGAAHGGDLKAALDDLLETGTVSADQKPSMGCNIKWAPGNAPA